MEIEEQLKRMIKESLLEEDLSISGTDNLVDDLGMDSMGYVDLAVKMELEFGTAFSDKAIRAAATFQDLMKLVLENLEK